MHVIALRFTLASLALVGTSWVCDADDIDSRPTDPECGLKLDTEYNWKLVNAHCGRFVGLEPGAVLV